MGTSLLGSEYRILWRAIRRPMLRWWWRVGVWLLAVMAAVHTGNIVVSFINYRSLSSSAFPTNYTPPLWSLGISFFIPTLGLVPVIWLWASTVCNRLVSPILDSNPLPGTFEFARARLLVVYAQGLIPLGFEFAFKLIEALLYKFSYFQPYTLGADVPFVSITDVLTSELHYTLGTGIFLAWLVLLLVLVPRIPIVAWGLLIASLGGSRAIYVLYLYLPLTGAKTRYYETPFWGWLLSAALVLTLVVALRARSRALASGSYCLLAFALLFRNVIGYILAEGNSGIAVFSLRLVSALPSFLFSSPFSWSEFLSLGDELYPAYETALGQLMHLLPLIVEPLWALGILALIYYVILGPWPPWRRWEATAEATSA